MSEHKQVKKCNNKECGKWYSRRTGGSNYHQKKRFRQSKFCSRKCAMYIRRILTERIVRGIHQSVLQGVKSKVLASKFNVSIGTVNEIATSKKWKHLNLEPITRNRKIPKWLRELKKKTKQIQMALLEQDQELLLSLKQELEQEMIL